MTAEVSKKLKTIIVNEVMVEKDGMKGVYS